MQALPTSAVIPFPRGGCMALPEGTDEYRASIKSAIQFAPSYHGFFPVSMDFWEKLRFCQTCTLSSGKWGGFCQVWSEGGALGLVPGGLSWYNKNHI